jgi:DNA-binding XRE family transcriptional regulator
VKIDTIIQDGRERIIMDRNDYEDLVDARDHAIAMRAIAAGAPVIPEAEMDDYLAAATPLAFWRKRSGKTQAVVAAEASISQAFLAQIETGKREGSVGVLVRIAKAIGVGLEDLVEEQPKA